MEAWVYIGFPGARANFHEWIGRDEAYTNEYGMQLGPCNNCGFCERYGCINYSKCSPQTCILDALRQMPNFSYKVNSEVLKIELAGDRKTATGVTYFDAAKQEEAFQPADLVIVAAYALHNVHLMLLSGIGEPWDPAQQTGTTGKNYSYQMNGGTRMFFKDIAFNPFAASGANGISIDDYAISQIDFAKEGFIGGSYITAEYRTVSRSAASLCPRARRHGVRVGNRASATGTAILCRPARTGPIWPTATATSTSTSTSTRPTRIATDARCCT